MTRNKDFQLCAEFGLADFVREWVITWNGPKIEMTRDAFSCFINTGVMPINPPIMGLLIEIYDFDTSKSNHMRPVEIAKNTLTQILYDIEGI